METPLYVVKALAEVREGGEVNMMDRRGVASLCDSERARAWIMKADATEYMDALNDMVLYLSIPTNGDDETEDEGDENGGNYSY